MGDVVVKTETCPIPLTGGRPVGRDQPEQLVFLIEDFPSISRSIGLVCEYLGIHLETVSSRSDLNALLRARRPMAVMSPVDTPAQDGCHVLKAVAAYDRDLPVLLVTGADPTILGAVEAVEEIWQLGHVQKATATPSIGDCAEFLSKAGRRSSHGRMAA